VRAGPFRRRPALGDCPVIEDLSLERLSWRLYLWRSCLEHGAPSAPLAVSTRRSVPTAARSRPPNRPAASGFRRPGRRGCRQRTSRRKMAGVKRPLSPRPSGATWINPLRPSSLGGQSGSKYAVAMLTRSSASEVREQVELERSWISSGHHAVAIAASPISRTPAPSRAAALMIGCNGAMGSVHNLIGVDLKSLRRTSRGSRPRPSP